MSDNAQHLAAAIDRWVDAMHDAVDAILRAKAACDAIMDEISTASVEHEWKASKLKKARGLPGVGEG